VWARPSGAGPLGASGSFQPLSALPVSGGRVPEALFDATQGRLNLLVAVFRLGAAPVDVEAGKGHEGEQLEELGLPVLERRLGELAREIAGRDALTVRVLLIGVGLPFGDGLGQSTSRRTGS
jgi:hypothetical protein